MFRAVADQIYGDEEMHHEVRRLCMDYVAKNRDHFSQFITEDFNEYLARKRLDNVHGNHVELQAMSEIFLRPIEVFEYSTDPINTFHPISREANTGVVNPPIRLSYHGSVHYNSGRLFWQFCYSSVKFRVGYKFPLFLLHCAQCKKGRTLKNQPIIL